METPRLRNMSRTVRRALEADTRRGLVATDHAVAALIEEFGEARTFDILKGLGSQFVSLADLCRALAPAVRAFNAPDSESGRKTTKKEKTNHE